MNESTPNVGARTTLVRRDGAGEPIVWLHDTLGNQWTEGHARLSHTHEVAAPSLPGFDDSTELAGIDSPEDVVFWLLDLLQELKADKPTLLGAGYGGWMAAEFAVRYPERLSRLVLVDAYGLRVEGALAEDEFALTPSVLRPLLFSSGDGALALQTVPDQQPPERVEAALHARVAAARLAWQFPYDRKLRGRLWRATVPSLVVWGESDRLVPVAHAHAYAAGLPQVRTEIINNAGHYPYLENPDAFAHAVTHFLEE